MSILKLPEYWMRGPVAGVPSLLQPVAHALLQARDEVNEMMQEFPASLLFIKPAGMASPAFHLQHLQGVIDRLFTYAKGEQLSSKQLLALTEEDKEDKSLTAAFLIEAFNHQVGIALKQLTETDESLLTDFRAVGRKQLPSTVIGLLFHAAEHTMRHTGQLLVTVQLLKHNYVSEYGKEL